MFKRTLYCSTCNREVKPGEEIYVKMKVPQYVGIVEIKAYLKNESRIYCTDCSKRN
ncbi:Fe3+ hydroxamate ABC transporter substrate-binding protein [Sporosarcina sp. P18a]|uniref:Fe3+ hydroxamate ABC transporter substrate-binding protein n=1 Tax=Sporosarcina sp. P18a TaxID=2048259 RepID=UPI001181A458|nr:Fe3+ hydroxamate ABC transporter substrate-binding protein [Sporosarcina sp. P18a]